MSTPVLGPGDRVHVAGHRGLVGSAIVRRLEREASFELLLRTRRELDLSDPDAVRAFMTRERPDHVIVAAARVGGILANSTRPADFIRDNLAIAVAVIDGAFQAGVRSLLFLGSSCIYPREAPQPMREEHLLTGPLEPTNEAYAVAKIAGVKMCDAYARQHGVRYFSVMPTNLYGPGDNFDLRTSHVLPALIRKFHEAVEEGRDRVVVWGTGRPRREFLHVDDLADACVFLLSRSDDRGLFNVGVGEDVSITELAALIADVVGFRGTIEYDTSKPDGMPRKLLDVGRMRELGWKARVGLRQGIEETYRWYVGDALAAGQAG